MQAKKKKHNKTITNIGKNCRCPKNEEFPKKENVPDCPIRSKQADGSWLIPSPWALAL